MKFFFFLHVLLSFSLSAHPGIGIVHDSQGNIFYTDLKQVWKISVDRKKSVAVPNVHTHELFIDQNDNLFGEHLWYNGESLNTWGHYVWKYSPDGTIEKVIPNSGGFLKNYSFVRDGNGTMYWTEEGKKHRIKKKNADGTVAYHSNNSFADIGRLHCSKNGTLYFVEGRSLLRLEQDGSSRVVVKNLFGSAGENASHPEQHGIMGIWSDSAQNIFLAHSSTKTVKKVTQRGEISIVARSERDWAPSGGVIDPHGTLWILEFSDSNEVRVRSFKKEGTEKVF